MALVCFLFGYSLWLIDNFACGSLVAVRNIVGMPVGFLFEFHGWYVVIRPSTLFGVSMLTDYIRWHVFTAIGGYNAVAIIDLITADEMHKDSTDLLAWPLPTVARLLDPGEKLKKQE